MTPSKNNKTRVSIGIPVYNGDRYLAAALDSFRAQSFGDFEIIVSDNASTDRTGDIARDYAGIDPRIRYVRQDRNIGAGPNHNCLLDLAESPYFKWAAHDDLYEPTYLEKCVAILDRRPDVVLAHSDGQMIDERSRPLTFNPIRQIYTDRSGHEVPKEPANVCLSELPSERFDDVLHRLVWCSAMYGLFRRDIASHLTLKRNFYGSDKVLLSEMALLGKFHHIPEALFKKRYHATMSARLDADRRRVFMDTERPAASPYFELLKGYLKAAMRVGDIDRPERLRCIASIMRKTARARYWRRQAA